MKLLKRILVGLLVLGLLVLVWFLFLRPGVKEIPFADRLSTISNPFGSPQVTPQTGTTIDVGTDGINPGENPFADLSSRARWRQMTNTPVAGYKAFTKTELIQVESTDPKTGQIVITDTPVQIEHLHYARSRDGVVVDARVDDESITQDERTTSQVPRLAEAFFPGSSVLARFGRTQERRIETYAGKLPVPPTPPAYCVRTFDTDLKAGSKGPEAKRLQEFLKDSVAPAIKPDGSFGQGTAAALKLYQARAEVAQNGIFDLDTRTKANVDCAAKIAEVEAQANTPQPLVGGFLPNELLQVAPSPDTGSFFGIVRSQTGVQGLTMTETGATPVQIFQSPFSEWMPQWANKNLITLTTYASTDAEGYLYGLDPTTKRFWKLIGPVLGLTTNTSPSGGFSLISESIGRTIGLRLIDLTTKTVTPIGLPTLPEKCVWVKDSTKAYCAVPKSIPDGEYPDQWYQGIISFEDDIWQIETNPVRTKKVFSTSDPLDLVRPSLSTNERYLYLTDKTTGFLYSLRIPE